MASAGVPPRIMGIGPVPSTRKLIANALGLKPRPDFDVIELNEAFAVAGARGVCASLASPTTREHVNRERRRDRARPSARHERRAVGRDRRLSTAPPGRPLRPVHDVHRRSARASRWCWNGREAIEARRVEIDAERGLSGWQTKVEFRGAADGPRTWRRLRRFVIPNLIEERRRRRSYSDQANSKYGLGPKIERTGER